MVKTHCILTFIRCAYVVIRLYHFIGNVIFSILILDTLQIFLWEVVPVASVLPLTLFKLWMLLQRMDSISWSWADLIGVDGLLPSSPLLSTDTGLSAFLSSFRMLLVSSVPDSFDFPFLAFLPLVCVAFLLPTSCALMTSAIILVGFFSRRGGGGGGGGRGGGGGGGGGGGVAGGFCFLARSLRESLGEDHGEVQGDERGVPFWG